VPLESANQIERIEARILRNAPTTTVRAQDTEQVTVHLPITTGFEPEKKALIVGNPDGNEKIARDEATLDSLTATPAVPASNSGVKGQSRSSVLRGKPARAGGHQRDGGDCEGISRTEHCDCYVGEV